MSTINIVINLHGSKVEVPAPVDAVLASEWAGDTKSALRIADATTGDAIAADRNANIGDARNIVNEAAAGMFRRRSDGWKDRAATARAALRMLRKVR